MAKQISARSINDRLSLLAKKLGKTFEVLAVEFLLERMAVRLANDPQLGKRLIFKGGYVAIRAYQSSRFTMDLDALLKNGSLDHLEKLAVPCIESDLVDGAFFKFENSLDLETQGEYGGKRLSFRAAVGEFPKNLQKARLINLDVGVGDPVTPGPIEHKIPALLEPSSLSWNIYPLETIVSEKLHALIIRGSENSRSKDIFDLSIFLPRCKTSDLQEALKATFAYRGSALPRQIPRLIATTDRNLLRKGWRSAMAQISPPPDFDETFNLVLDALAKHFPE